ncbi:MAG: glycosyltransferase family 2 protein [Lachnospiraceae bacterium]|nr:glycosyltransferase family 2 protein [Lachnospiraceae bacterium]
MATVSVCMIVKNEENVLERCLESLKELADELIVVDTGSTDGTKAIAAKYTDKVYDFAWIDDFAAARNFAFSKATCDYIYSADADEVLDIQNIARFKALKRDLDETGYEMVQFWYCNQLEHNTTYNFDKELRPKLYKRVRTFEWVDPVHETVRMEPTVFDSNIEIIHKPEKPHGTRDFAIFEKVIAKGESLSKHLRGMYARELMISGTARDFAAARPYFEILADVPEIDQEELIDTFCVLAKAAQLANDTDSFFAVVLKVFVLPDPPSEICCMLGEHYEKLGNRQEALLWFTNALYETKPVLALEYGGERAKAGIERNS